MRKTVFTLFLFLFVSCQSFKDKMMEVDEAGRKTTVNIIKVEDLDYKRVTLLENLNDSHISVQGENIKISGTAYDKGGISQITLHIGNAEYNVNGKENWQLQFSVPYGSTQVRASIISTNDKEYHADPIYIQRLWKQVNSIPNPWDRFSHASIMYNSNSDSFYVAGGYLHRYLMPFMDVFFKVNSNYSINSGQLNYPTTAPAIAYNATHIFVVGGLNYTLDSKKALNKLQVFDIANGTWAQTDITNTYTRGAAAFLQKGDMVYIFGGYDINGNITNTILSYNISTQTWAVEATLPIKMVEAVASLDDTGNIFIFAGWGGSGASYNYLNSIYYFNTTTKQVTTDIDVGIKLSFKRAGHCTAKLNDKIYLMGGRNQDGYVKNIEVLDLNANTVTEVAPIPFGISNMACAADSSKILTVGGINDKGFVQSGIYEYIPEN